MYTRAARVSLLFEHCVSTYLTRYPTSGYTKRWIIFRRTAGLHPEIPFELLGMIDARTTDELPRNQS